MEGQTEPSPHDVTYNWLCPPQGTFRSADGRIFEGDLVYEQIMAHCLNSSRELNPLSGKALQPIVNAPSPDWAVSYLCLLPVCVHKTWLWASNVCWPRSLLENVTLSTNRCSSSVKCPPSFEAWADAPAGFQQVAFAVLKHGAELRSIYRFYSRLGRAHSPHSLFQLTRLQLWRLLKDCHIHHHFPLSQTDQFMRGEGEFPPMFPPCGSAGGAWCLLSLCVSDEATMTDVHSPFTPIFLRQLLSSLVAVAYHIYHEDLV